jgi:hypothetical protein
MWISIPFVLRFSERSDAYLDFSHPKPDKDPGKNGRIEHHAHTIVEIVFAKSGVAAISRVQAVG